MNIDADLVRADTELSRTDETLVAMSNGCVCCMQRDDLLQEVLLLATEGRLDCLFIESTVISAPRPVAARFDFRDATGESLLDVARRDTMVTVVDAVDVLKNCSSHDFLSDRSEMLGEGGDRTLVSLLVELIDCADVVMLNEVTDAGTESTDAARKIIRSLNAGALSSVKPLGTWWAAIPQDRWPDHASAQDCVAQHWVEPWGDRRQGIVFIGVGIDCPSLKARRDACLLTKRLAPGPDTLPDLPDPFPGWRRAEAA